MLSTLDASLTAGRSLDLVRRWLRQGRIEGAVKSADGTWLIPVASIDALRRMPRRPGRSI